MKKSSRCIMSESMANAKPEAPEPKYQTRYGIMTASKAALNLLDRAHFRVSFLGVMFSAYGNQSYDDDDGVRLAGYDADGLSFILEDIAYDTQMAYNYYFGDDDMPGKM
jgi:hypothetical protein